MVSSCSCHLIGFLVASLVTLSSTYTAQDEFNLVNKLLQIDSQILPLWNQTETTSVHLGFTFQSIHDLDEKRQIFEASGNLRLLWRSDILSWDEKEYGGLRVVMLEPNQVWTPHLEIESSAGSKQHIGKDRFLVRLEHNGEITWYPEVIVQTQCSLEVSRYPFDTQTCSVNYTLGLNYGGRLRLYAMHPYLLLHLFKENGEWELSDHYIVNETAVDRHDKIVCRIILKRRVAYHVLNTVLPVILLSMLNVLVFVLPPEAEEKMSLSITVLLAFAFFISLFNQDMPPISTSVSVLAVYMVITLGMGTASTFLSAVILHYAHNDDGRKRRFLPQCHSHPRNVNAVYVSGKGKSTAAASGMNFCGEVSESREKLHSGNSQYQGDIMFRRDLVDRIDVASFWIFSALTSLFTIVCFVLMTTAKF